MTKLIIMSGLPGSGKSTLARTLAGAEAVCSTDDYPTLYTPSGEFTGMEKDPDFGVKVGRAHNWNQKRAYKLMEEQEPVVVIDNTNVARWEFEPYIIAAEKFGYTVERRSIFDAGLSDVELAARNTHGVPLTGIARMRANYEHDLDGDPRPPWLR
jgi:predicted kinase